MASTPREDDEPYQIDEATLFRVLKTSKGNRRLALAMIQESKAEWVMSDLEEAIEHSSILRAYFGSSSPLNEADGVDPENALLRLPDTNEEPDSIAVSKVIDAQDNYLMARGLRGVGFSEDDIQEMESMAQFVGHGFKKTVDMTHGIMVSQLWKLHKRADEIREILNNNEEAERVEVTDRGQIVRYNTARFTDAEKLEWQKEYTNIIDQIRRISDSAHQGAAIRMKAELASREASEQSSKKPKRKLRSVN